MADMLLRAPNDSLINYDHPHVVTKTTDKPSPNTPAVRAVPTPDYAASGGGAPDGAAGDDEEPLQKSSMQQKDFYRGNFNSSEEVLDAILPPREWVESNQLWLQRVSRTPATRLDVMNLQGQLDIKLEQRQARETGVCAIRRELYSQCFDELIRQVTINCAERGLLLLRIRDEKRMTLAAYQTLFESSMAYGMRKCLLSEQGKAEMEEKTRNLEQQKLELEREVNEGKIKCDLLEKRHAEQRQLDEKRHQEEIQNLKRTNQQLKSQLEGIINPKAIGGSDLGKSSAK